MNRLLAFLLCCLLLLSVNASGCRRSGRSEAARVEVSGPAPVEELGLSSYYEAATDAELEAVFGDEHGGTFLDAHPVPLSFADEPADSEWVALAETIDESAASRPATKASTAPRGGAESTRAKKRPVVDMLSRDDDVPEPFWGVVVKVHDGDTVDVQKGEERYRIRLYGVDTPEKRQTYGQEAKTFTRHLVDERVVEVRTKAIGPYGRLIAEVHLPGNVRLSRALVKAGCGWWYRRFARLDASPEAGESVSEGRTLKDLEDEARAEKRGLWAAEKPEAPWDWRRKDKRRRAKKARASGRRSRG